MSNFIPLGVPFRSLTLDPTTAGSDSFTLTYLTTSMILLLLVGPNSVNLSDSHSRNDHNVTSLVDTLTIKSTLKDLTLFGHAAYVIFYVSWQEVHHEAHFQDWGYIHHPASESQSKMHTGTIFTAKRTLQHYAKEISVITSCIFFYDVMCMIITQMQTRGVCMLLCAVLKSMFGYSFLTKSLADQNSPRALAQFASCLASDLFDQTSESAISNFD